MGVCVYVCVCVHVCVRACVCMCMCSLFLVRDSTKLPGHFVLSLMNGGRLTNFRIKHVSWCGGVRGERE